MATAAVAGVTLRVLTVAVGTVTCALAASPPNVAEIIAVPGATALTTPAATVATLGESVDHVAVAVTSCRI